MRDEKDEEYRACSDALASVSRLLGLEAPTYDEVVGAVADRLATKPVGWFVHRTRPNVLDDPDPYAPYLSSPTGRAIVSVCREGRISTRAFREALARVMLDDQTIAQINEALVLKRKFDKRGR